MIEHQLDSQDSDARWHGSIFVLLITDIDQDERYFGTYESRAAAEDAYKFITEYDLTVKNHRIIEDFVRARGDD